MKEKKKNTAHQGFHGSQGPQRLSNFKLRQAEAGLLYKRYNLGDCALYFLNPLHILYI